MVVDARTVADGEAVEADVCVAGGGVAGLATALELEAAGVRVALVEHGEDLEDGEVKGAYPPLASTRAGGLGGTAAVWTSELAPGQLGARCAPLAPIDFEAREGIPWSGWPFDRAHLEPFYARAREFCGAGPFDDVAAAQDGDVAGVPFGHSPRSLFTHEYPARVVRSDSIRAFVGGTAVEVERAGDAISSLRVAAGAGRSFTVRARAFVLALGGVENARFLLLAGLGDAHDLVGRFFMDHRRVNVHLAVTAFGLAAETLRREGLPNGGFFVVPAADAPGGWATSRPRLTGGSPARFRRSRRRRGSPRGRRSSTPSASAQCPAGRGCAGRRAPSTSTTWSSSGWSAGGAWSSGRAASGLAGRSRACAGSSPTASSRRSTGRSGSSRARWSTPGLGRLRTAREVVDELYPTAHHHLGTARMADDPRRGVVDPDGRVHGIPNLDVTGGSVFPTAGYVNPTLTMVALAARLAAHLREAQAA
jgi:glycine/D-amino acid oxidase-like deaminating enzyme